MEYEVRAFLDMVEGNRPWDVYEKASKNTAFVLEKARKQMGIRFPADEK